MRISTTRSGSSVTLTRLRDGPVAKAPDDNSAAAHIESKCFVSCRTYATTFLVVSTIPPCLELKKACRTALKRTAVIVPDGLLSVSLSRNLSIPSRTGNKSNLLRCVVS